MHHSNWNALQLAVYRLSYSNIPSTITCKCSKKIHNNVRISVKSIATAREEKVKYRSLITSHIPKYTWFQFSAFYSKSKQMLYFIVQPAVMPYCNHKIQKYFIVDSRIISHCTSWTPKIKYPISTKTFLHVPEKHNSNLDSRQSVARTNVLFHLFNLYNKLARSRNNFRKHLSIP